MTYRAKEMTGVHKQPTVLMLLTNAYDPDPRVRQEALTLIGMGCCVKLLAWDRDAKAPRSECMEGIEVERVFLASGHGRGTTQLFFYALLYLRMLWCGLRIRFDVVHCHDLDTLPLGFLLGKFKQKPIVYDAHESFPDMLEGSIHRFVKRSLVRLEHLLIRRIDLLITVGEKLRRHFEESGVRHSVVVGNWKRLEEYSQAEPKRIRIRRKLGIPPDATVVVYITHLLKDRNIPEFLEAIDATPDVYAIVGGRGAFEDFVTGWTAKQPRIKFVGFVQGPQIPDYTCAADVVFYGFDIKNPNARFSAPNKLYEALAAGRPLVTGDFGEIGEVVRAAKCGFVLPDYTVNRIVDAFATLRDDHELRRSMAAEAKSCGRVLMNWEKAEDILHREYSALIPNLGPVRPTLQMRAAQQ